MALIYSDSKTQNLKSYVAVNHKHITQSKPSVRTVKMSRSSTPAFEFLKKASSIALIQRSLELIQIICLILQDILTKHGIYTWKKLFEGRLSLTYFSSIKMNKQNIIVS